jgi:HK97 gp10 family phage protein
MARASITNVSRVTAKLDDLSRDARREVSQAVFKGAQRIATRAAKLIKDGAVSGAGHIPSRPGEPPNADTHFLDRSIRVVQVNELTAEVQVTADYARPLELGTSKMAARPFLGPAARLEEDAAAIDFLEGLAKARGLR